MKKMIQLLTPVCGAALAAALIFAAPAGAEDAAKPAPAQKPKSAEKPKGDAKPEAAKPAEAGKNAASVDPAKEGYVKLFNGKDLKGWKGDMDLWKVEKGEIVGSTEKKKIERNTFLATEKKYSDFSLRAKVKLRNGNSGIQFRSEWFEDFVVMGYQADVATETFFGMLYEEGKRGFLDYWKKLSEEERKAIFAAAKQGEWNEYEIECKGDHLKMVLNGKTTVDMDDPAGAKEGVIALQLHVGAPMQVHYKDLWIKELK